MTASRPFLLNALLRALAWALAALPLQARAQPPAALPKGVEYVTNVEGISEYRLANGLRVLLFPDASKQTVTVNVTYLVGSRHENYGETGMAHLLEHLLFKGTPKHPNIPQELSERGARTNGTTSFDRTNYFETLTAAGDNLEWALRMEADRMVNSFIARKDLDSEMTVVRNEFESGENNPFSVLLKRMSAAAFDWHNYGKLPIGNRSDIENVAIDNLQGFYQKYYQPDNAVLLIAGRFEEKRALDLVADSFGRIARPTRALPRTYTVEPTQDGERSVTSRRVGDTQIVAAAFRAPPGASADFAALDLLTFILSDTPSGRLHKALVETKKASSVGGFSYKLYDPGLLMLNAEVRRQDSLDAARDAMLAVLDDVQRNPPTKDEVERARANYLKQVDLTMNSSDRFGVSLSNWMGIGDWRLFFLNRDRVKQVKPEDVARVAANYLRPANRTLGFFIPDSKPQRAEIPATPDVAALVKDYKGDESVATGEAFDPSPTNIESRVKRSGLSAGLKLALLPKKTRGAKVVATLVLRFGDEQSLRGKTVAAAVAGDMLGRGTKQLSRQQIQDELDRLRAQVNVNGDAGAASASVETVRDNLPAVLRVLAQILREPTFTPTEFEQLKSEQLAEIEQQMSDPRALAGLQLNRHLNPYPKDDVRYVPSFDEQIAWLKSVKLEDAAQFHRDFYGASNAELAVVGDFDAQQITRLAGELFGDWKSPQPYARIVKRYQEIAPINEKLQTPDKANAFYVGGLRLNIRDDDADFPALMIANEIMGGGFLNSRLATRIRQKDGLSYGVGSRLVVDSEDKIGRFSTYAIYAPQNLARLETAFSEELARAVKDGFTKDEIERAKTGLLQGRSLSRAQDGALAASLAAYLHLERTFAWDESLDLRLRALTAEDVAAVLRKYVNPEKFSVIKAGDFAKALTQ